MRLHRLIAILLLLESRGRMKANELSIALETSVRSIYRDIDVLAESGIPLVTTTGPNGGISLMEGYTVSLRRLHGEEVVQLFLTGMGMPAGGSGETSLLLKNALLKLEASLPAPYQEDIRTAQRRFLFDDTPWWSGQAAVPYLETLRTAVWRGRKITADYLKVNGESSLRKLQPYGLIVKQGEWYLAAYCESAGDLRTFKCERFTAVTLLEETYAIPEQFSLQAYWSQAEQAFVQTSRAREFYQVVIRTRVKNEQMLQGLEVMNTGSDGDAWLFTVNMYDYSSACARVLPLLVHAEIVGPPELREYVSNQVRMWDKMYNCSKET
ncbi:helix-turn-helix transcriptional regulator [Paenibacillus silagei]|uniref:DNA-binding transcriptional regulator YafY n=1 Tax=Paenibacillus silagei TaxID=1670801 RepID=A0ABS4NTA7_9BACL|nr:WYL domain-containing protein [Paenibacillus silagei]MBP2112644.1 putative DNA-binding transcriptional regulator YafY [Paenibacillus silagei]